MGDAGGLQIPPRSALGAAWKTLQDFQHLADAGGPYRLTVFGEAFNMVKAAELPNPATKEPKDLRYRKLHFPNAEYLVFNTARKGFVPMPILLRKLMRHLSAPELRVLVYLHLRSSKYGICYPTQDEMAYELGLQGTKNLAPYLKSLEAKHLISTKLAMGKKFYLVHDPRVGIQHLLKLGKFKPEEIEEIDQLCIDLAQPPFQKPEAHQANSADTAQVDMS